MFKTGSVLINAFIAFLALKMDLHCLMIWGALFQAQVASFMNFEVAFLETPSSNRLPFEIAPQVTTIKNCSIHLLLLQPEMAPHTYMRHPTLQHGHFQIENYFLSHFSLLQFMTSQRKLYMVGKCSTVRKQAKRTWDTIVEPTRLKAPVCGDRLVTSCKFMTSSIYFRTFSLHSFTQSKTLSSDLTKLFPITVLIYTRRPKHLPKFF